VENLKKIGWFFTYWISITAGIYGILYVAEFLANNFGVSLKDDMLIQHFGKTAFLIGLLAAYFLSTYVTKK